MIKKCTLLIVAFLSLTMANGQIKGQDFSVDQNGNVLISKILENVNLSQNDIFLAAKKYMENSYKDTKYKITVNTQEQGVIVGEGEYLQFYEDNIFPYNYFLNAPFSLRVDAKEGRARISIILSDYTGKRSNINETVDIQDRISEFQPVNEKTSERKKLYSKAFPVLFSKAQKTLAEVEETLTSSQSSVLDSDW